MHFATAGEKLRRSASALRGGGVEECRSAVQKCLQLMRNTSAQDVGFAAGTRRKSKRSLVATGEVGECWGLGWLLLGTIRTKEIKDAAYRPITYRDPENESNDDGEKQKERKQKRRHIPLILQCVRAIGEPSDGRRTSRREPGASSYFTAR